jgi:hypothetical protein
LANYLADTRSKWSEHLLRIRNDFMEHGTSTLDGVRHEIVGVGFRAVEPLVAGQPVTEFAGHIVDRVCCFVEELCIHALQLRMPQGVPNTEISLQRRERDNVARFRIALIGGGTPIGTISYHESRFDET